MSSLPEPTYWLPCYRRLAFSVGHVLNDLCASIWFSYLLIFYHHVLNFSNENAGFLMLLGQLADAIATPLVGYESDRINCCFWDAKRKSWHLLGMICVAVTFPFLFMQCLGCYNNAEYTIHTADWVRFIYYAPFVVIFQFGWASTQISHLSLIPELTPNSSERVELNAIRYAFTVCSNIAVYVTAWLLLQAADSDSKMGPKDAGTFRNLVLIMVSFGTVISIFFHIFTKERRNEGPQRRLLSKLSSCQSMNSKDWLKEPQFYMITFLYMCTRLIVNVSQIYLPMFLTDSLNLPQQYIATVPLAVFISSFLASFITSFLNRILGRKITFILGLLMVLGAVTWMFFLRHATDLEVFGAAILLGMGGSMLLVTSLSMTADLIGDRTESGAFVYGAMSFTDKLSNGIAVVVIQHLHPCKLEACCLACVWFYRDMIVFVPGGVAIVAFIGIIIIAPQNIGFLRKSVDFPDRDTQCSLESDGTPLFGSGRKSHVEDSDLACCSYPCCVSLSGDAQDNKVALCSTCGQKTCRHRHVQAKNRYNSITGNNECGVTQRTPSGSRREASHDATLPEVMCAHSSAELHSCATECVTVNADVHT